MQAVYFIALFGLVFAVISSFTVGIGASSMQVKESRLEEVQRNFDNLEFAINNVVLKERISLGGPGNVIPGLDASVTMLGAAELNNFLPFMRASSTDLIKDPWRSDIRYLVLEVPTVFCEDPNPSADKDCLVRAPVAYFVMVSAGTNRIFESGWDNAGGFPEADPLRFLNYPQGGDDIIKVFNTDAPMRAHYNNMLAVQDRVASLILKSYRDQAAAFFASSQVQDYIRQELEDRLNGGFFPPSNPVGPTGADATVMDFQQPFGREVTPNTEPPATPPQEPPAGCGQDCLPFDITQEDIYGDILTLPEAQGLVGPGWPGYPRMKGNSIQNTPRGTRVAIEPQAYGAESEMQFDPFCVAAESGSNCQPFRIWYDDVAPSKVVLHRFVGADETGGWYIDIKQTIDGMEEL